MPVYDFRCPAGHVTEHRVSRDAREMPCSCGQAAARQLSSAVGIGGIVSAPARERYVPLSRAQEAHDTIVHEYTKAGREPPDLVAAGRRQAAFKKRHGLDE